jgi:hypothetical protein
MRGLQRTRGRSVGAPGRFMADWSDDPSKLETTVVYLLS